MSPQKSLFDSDEDVSIKFPNAHARGEFTFEKKEVIRGGERRKMNAFTVNAAKVSDYTTHVLQKAFKGKLNYQEIRARTEDLLKETFIEYKLLDFDPANKAQAERNRRMMNIMIDEKVKELIRDIVKDECIIKIPFEEFFKNLNISSLYKGDNIRFDRAVELVLEVQSKSYCDYRGKRVIEDETGKLEEISYVGKSALVPSIEFEFDSEIGEINKIEDLIASKKRNKAKYIKSVVLKFDPDTFALLALPGREYVLASRETRSSFESIHTFRLDLLVRSIEKIQHYTSLNRYTLDHLNRLFGVSYSNFSFFKKRVLDPACEELNRCEDLHVEYNSFKKGNRFDYISFVITRKNKALLGGEYREFDLPYYIAVQHFYFDEYINGEVSSSFMEHYHEIKFYTDKFEKNKNFSYGGEETNDKTLLEWEKEYLEASEAYKELVMIIGKDPGWFNERNLVLSPEKLCLVDKDTGDVHEPYKGLLAISNPIKSLMFYKAETGKAT